MRAHVQLRKSAQACGFGLTELLVILAVLAVLAALVIPTLARSRAKSRLALCTGNVQKVNRAVLQFAEDNDQRLPRVDNSPAPGGWWYYKEQVKGYLGLTGPPSTNDLVFACPDDRGYEDEGEKSRPFCKSRKYVFTSYVFNGVNLPGTPNVAGRQVSSIIDPQKTLLVMEWTAHGPLSWHRSRTGKANTPFYNDAENVVGFVDGHAEFIKIYYDGLNAAYTRDPPSGYNYKYSGD